MAKLKHIFNELHFELVRVVAEGGMGVVYEGHQHGSGQFVKRVAVKLIREEYSKIEAFRNNFVGEARLVADLIHTNIVQTYHLGEISGQYFMTMEYVDGITQGDFIARHNSTNQCIPADLATFIISRICRGLAYAHQKCDKEGRPLGIVHRDVNPRNIMVSFEGDVKLTDFGIAKALNLMYNEEGKVIAGKDEYLSPEQAERQVTDARADLFSCGVVLSEMICGRNLFEVPESPEQTRANIVAMALPDWRRYRDPLDEEVSEILDRALERSRERRYQSAEAMMKALEMCIYGRGYGPTAEKLARYLSALFANGKAYADDLPRSTQTFGFGSRRRL
ncbi:MAG: serine/threonine protein kinase [Verrucomicrobiota bacterium]